MSPLGSTDAVRDAYASASRISWTRIPSSLREPADEVLAIGGRNARHDEQVLDTASVHSGCHSVATLPLMPSA